MSTIGDLSKVFAKLIQKLNFSKDYIAPIYIEYYLKLYLVIYNEFIKDLNVQRSISMTNILIIALENSYGQDKSVVHGVRFLKNNILLNINSEKLEEDTKKIVDNFYAKVINAHNELYF